MDEDYDILDENGNKTGQIKPYSLVHRDGDWHKAVHVWVVNDKNEILLQKRSPYVDNYPNMWDISSAGHITVGEDSVTGAIRELNEELGIDIQPEQLALIGTRKKPANPMSLYKNAEFNDVYLLRLSIDLNDIQIQEEEVTHVKFVSINEFQHMIQTKDKTLLMHLDEFEMLFNALGVENKIE